MSYSVPLIILRNGALRLSNLQRALNRDKYFFRDICYRGVWKFLNLEALKCHFWCSNPNISVKNLR